MANKKTDPALETAVGEAYAAARRLKRKQGLIDEIIERTQYRSRVDIQRWRSALNMAENMDQPRRYNLIKVYDEIFLDAHIRGIIENTLKEAVKSKPYKVVDKSGKEVLEASQIFKSSWFNDLIDYTIEARFFGHSLVDVRYDKTKVSIYLVPRIHVEPINGYLLKYETDWDGPCYRETHQNYFVEIGKERDLGLLNPCVPYALFKKNAFIAWSEYADIFGMPFRSAYTTSRKVEDLNRLEASLQQMGKAAYGVFIKGVEEFQLETPSNGSSSTGNSVYDKLVDKCNTELSKLLLGNTLSTESGANGSRAHAQTHMGITEDIIMALMRNIEFMVNDQLIPALTYQGLTLLNGLKFSFPTQDNVDEILKSLDIVLKYKDVPDKWIEEKLGIPVTSKAETTAPVTEPPASAKKKSTKPQDALMKMHQDIAALYSGKECC